MGRVSDETLRERRARCSSLNVLQKDGERSCAPVRRFRWVKEVIKRTQVLSKLVWLNERVNRWRRRDVSGGNSMMERSSTFEQSPPLTSMNSRSSWLSFGDCEIMRFAPSTMEVYWRRRLIFRAFRDLNMPNSWSTKDCASGGSMQNSSFESFGIFERAKRRSRQTLLEPKEKILGGHGWDWPYK